MTTVQHIRKRNRGRAGIKVIERQRRFAKPEPQSEADLFAKKTRLKWGSRPWSVSRLVISDAHDLRELLDYWQDTGRYQWPNGETGTLPPNDLLAALKIAHHARSSGRPCLEPHPRSGSRVPRPNAGTKATVSQAESRTRPHLSPADQEALERLREGKGVSFKTRQGLITAQLVGDSTAEVGFRTSTGYLVLQAWFDGTGSYVEPGFQEFRKYSGKLWEFCVKNATQQIECPGCRLGAKVWLKDMQSGRICCHHMTNSVSSRAARGMIATNFAMDNAVAGRKSGDHVALKTDSGVCKYKIIRVALPGSADFSDYR